MLAAAADGDRPREDLDQAAGAMLQGARDLARVSRDAAGLARQLGPDLAAAWPVP